MITYSDFQKVEMRVGKILSCEPFPEARKPAYKLTIDFGESGVKKSSAQITELYRIPDLIGLLVVCVTNFPPKQIGPFVSEVLTLGVSDDNGRVALLRPDEGSPLGSIVF
ncbi:molecular chaperone [Candidatus Peribacteria bacterium RIFCSPLOWO2_02_FULL_51_10]|nr:MAG: molecular chaperone [Candidatus Peribacteria bacterium RIFCSPHIGHO2_02_FULL_51_15]OGJ67806.1 MAG: molecular chaperone [Candidatus Peribacteria bacterium RIFCSPLOWO2_02_FULL_51_10]